MKQDLILVVGATGTVGSELVKILKSSGQAVRTTTSKKASSQGSDKVFVDLVSGEGLTKAFEGVTKAFFLSPAGYANQQAILSPLIQGAKRRSLDKVVLMTALGANAVDTSPLRKAEMELEKSGLEYHIIRPNWFFQNFSTFWLHGILEQGKILVPGGEGKASFIDSRDISAVAAKLLTGKFSQKDFDLTGPESLNHAQVAKMISQATGKQITYEDISPGDFKVGLVQAGLSPDYADLLNAIFGYLRMGAVEKATSCVKEILQREPISFAQYAKEFKHTWK